MACWGGPQMLDTESKNPSLGSSPSLRQYFPQGTNLKPYSADYLNAVASELNGRPRKTLGWQPLPRPSPSYCQNQTPKQASLRRPVESAVGFSANTKKTPGRSAARRHRRLASRGMCAWVVPRFDRPVGLPIGHPRPLCSLGGAAQQTSCTGGTYNPNRIQRWLGLP